MLAGCVQEPSKREVLRIIKAQDDVEQKIIDERKQSRSFRKKYLTDVFHAATSGGSSDK